MEPLLALLSQHYYLPMRIVLLMLCVCFVVEVTRLLQKTGEKQIIAVLYLIDADQRLPISHYETTIGRAKDCDVVIPLATISRQHAVLKKVGEGLFALYDTRSTGGILFSRRRAGELANTIRFGEQFSLAGASMTLLPPSRDDIQMALRLDLQNKMPWQLKLEAIVTQVKQKFCRLSSRHKKAARRPKGSIKRAFLWLNLFQLFAYFGLALSLSRADQLPLLLSFVVMMLLPWGYRLLGLALGIKNMGAEAIAFFLSTMSLCVVATGNPGELFKQLIAILLGVVFFCLVCVVLKHLDWVMRFRLPVAGLSLFLLMLNLLLGSTINGQRNWIRLGSISIQPSELVKVLFVFACAATLEWLLTTRNLARLTVYAMGCIAFLVLMGDFGTVLVFFFAFLLLMFMTTGNIRAVVMSMVSAGVAGLLLLIYKPYIMRRFAGWRSIWADPWGHGFQQTQSLMAIVSGGLLGLGGGRGSLRQVFAADTDLVIGVVAEEWGLLMAGILLYLLTLLLLSAMRSHPMALSSYYVIAGCAAGGMLLFQSVLNVFGTTDIIPLTGITLPFVSNGGSSMIGSFGLLAFIVASVNYTRPNSRSHGVAAKP